MSSTEINFLEATSIQSNVPVWRYNGFVAIYLRDPNALFNETFVNSVNEITNNNYSITDSSYMDELIGWGFKFSGYSNTIYEVTSIISYGSPGS